MGRPAATQRKAAADVRKKTAAADEQKKATAAGAAAADVRKKTAAADDAVADAARKKATAADDAVADAVATGTATDVLTDTAADAAGDAAGDVAADVAADVVSDTAADAVADAVSDTAPDTPSAAAVPVPRGAVGRESSLRGGLPDRARVLEELSAIAFANAADYVGVADGRAVARPTSELDARQRAALAGVEQGSGGVKVKLYDKLRALELLYRLLEEGAAGDDAEGAQTGVVLLPAAPEADAP